MATQLDLLFAQHPEKLGRKAKEIGLANFEQRALLAYTVTNSELPFAKFKEMMQQPVAAAPEPVAEPTEEPVRGSDLPDAEKQSILTRPEKPPSQSAFNSMGFSPTGWTPNPVKDEWVQTPEFKAFREQEQARLEQIAADKAKAADKRDDPVELWQEPQAGPGREPGDALLRILYSPDHPKHPDYQARVATPGWTPPKRWEPGEVVDDGSVNKTEDSMVTRYRVNNNIGDDVSDEQLIERLWHANGEALKKAKGQAFDFHEFRKEMLEDDRGNVQQFWERFIGSREEFKEHRFATGLARRYSQDASALMQGFAAAVDLLPIGVQTTGEWYEALMDSARQSEEIAQELDTVALGFEDGTLFESAEAKEGLLAKAGEYANILATNPGGVGQASYNRLGEFAWDVGMTMAGVPGRAIYFSLRTLGVAGNRAQNDERGLFAYLGQKAEENITGDRSVPIHERHEGIKATDVLIGSGQAALELGGMYLLGRAVGVGAGLQFKAGAIGRAATRAEEAIRKFGGTGRKYGGRVGGAVFKGASRGSAGLAVGASEELFTEFTDQVATQIWTKTQPAFGELMSEAMDAGFQAALTIGPQAGALGTGFGVAEGLTEGRTPSVQELLEDSTLPPADGGGGQGSQIDMEWEGYGDARPPPPSSPGVVERARERGAARVNEGDVASPIGGEGDGSMIARAKQKMEEIPVREDADVKLQGQGIPGIGARIEISTGIGRNVTVEILDVGENDKVHVMFEDTGEVGEYDVSTLRDIALKDESSGVVIQVGGMTMQQEMSNTSEDQQNRRMNVEVMDGMLADLDGRAPEVALEVREMVKSELGANGVASLFRLDPKVGSQLIKRVNERIKQLDKVKKTAEQKQKEREQEAVDTEKKNASIVELTTFAEGMGNRANEIVGFIKERLTQLGYSPDIRSAPLHVVDAVAKMVKPRFEEEQKKMSQKVKEAEGLQKKYSEMREKMVEGQGEGHVFNATEERVLQSLGFVSVEDLFQYGDVQDMNRFITIMQERVTGEVQRQEQEVADAEKEVTEAEDQEHESEQEEQKKTTIMGDFMNMLQDRIAAVGEEGDADAEADSVIGALLDIMRERGMIGPASEGGDRNSMVVKALKRITADELGQVMQSLKKRMSAIDSGRRKDEKVQKDRDKADAKPAAKSKPKEAEPKPKKGPVENETIEQEEVDEDALDLQPGKKQKAKPKKSGGQDVVKPKVEEEIVSADERNERNDNIQYLKEFLAGLNEKQREMAINIMREFLAGLNVEVSKGGEINAFAKMLYGAESNDGLKRVNDFVDRVEDDFDAMDVEVEVSEKVQKRRKKPKKPKEEESTDEQKIIAKIDGDEAGPSAKDGETFTEEDEKNELMDDLQAIIEIVGGDTPAAAENAANNLLIERKVKGVKRGKAVEALVEFAREMSAEDLRDLINEYRIKINRLLEKVDADIKARNKKRVEKAISSTQEKVTLEDDADSEDHAARSVDRTANKILKRSLVSRIRDRLRRKKRGKDDGEAGIVPPSKRVVDFVRKFVKGNTDERIPHIFNQAQMEEEQVYDWLAGMLQELIDIKLKLVGGDVSDRVLQAIARREIEEVIRLAELFVNGVKYLPNTMLIREHARRLAEALPRIVEQILKSRSVVGTGVKVRIKDTRTDHPASYQRGAKIITLDFIRILGHMGTENLPYYTSHEVVHLLKELGVITDAQLKQFYEMMKEANPDAVKEIEDHYRDAYKKHAEEVIEQRVHEEVFAEIGQQITHDGTYRQVLPKQALGIFEKFQIDLAMLIRRMRNYLGLSVKGDGTNPIEVRHNMAVLLAEIESGRSGAAAGGNRGQGEAEPSGDATPTPAPESRAKKDDAEEPEPQEETAPEPEPEPEQEQQAEPEQVEQTPAEDASPFDSTEDDTDAGDPFDAMFAPKQSEQSEVEQEPNEAVTQEPESDQITETYPKKLSDGTRMDQYKEFMNRVISNVVDHFYPGKKVNALNPEKNEWVPVREMMGQLMSHWGLGRRGVQYKNWVHLEDVPANLYNEFQEQIGNLIEGRQLDPPPPGVPANPDGTWDDYKRLPENVDRTKDDPMFARDVTFRYRGENVKQSELLAKLGKGRDPSVAMTKAERDEFQSEFGLTPEQWMEVWKNDANGWREWMRRHSASTLYNENPIDGINDVRIKHNISVAMQREGLTDAHGQMLEFIHYAWRQLKSGKIQRGFFDRKMSITGIMAENPNFNMSDAVNLLADLGSKGLLDKVFENRKNYPKEWIDQGYVQPVGRDRDAETADAREAEERPINLELFARKTTKQVAIDPKKVASRGSVGMDVFSEVKKRRGKDSFVVIPHDDEFIDHVPPEIDEKQAKKHFTSGHAGIVTLWGSEKARWWGKRTNNDIRPMNAKIFRWHEQIGQQYKPADDADAAGKVENAYITGVNAINRNARPLKSNYTVYRIEDVDHDVAVGDVMDFMGPSSTTLSPYLAMLHGQMNLGMGEAEGEGGSGTFYQIDVPAGIRASLHYLPQAELTIASGYGMRIVDIVEGVPIRDTRSFIKMKMGKMIKAEIVELPDHTPANRLRKMRQGAKKREEEKKSDRQLTLFARTVDPSKVIAEPRMDSSATTVGFRADEETYTDGDDLIIGLKKDYGRFDDEEVLGYGDFQDSYKDEYTRNTAANFLEGYNDIAPSSLSLIGNQMNLFSIPDSWIRAINAMKKLAKPMKNNYILYRGEGYTHDAKIDVGDVIEFPGQFFASMEVGVATPYASGHVFGTSGTNVLYQINVPKGTRAWFGSSEFGRRAFIFPSGMGIRVKRVIDPRTAERITDVDVNYDVDNFRGRVPNGKLVVADLVMLEDDFTAEKIEERNERIIGVDGEALYFNEHLPGFRVNGLIRDGMDDETIMEMAEGIMRRAHGVSIDRSVPTDVKSDGADGTFYESKTILDTESGDAGPAYDEHFGSEMSEDEIALLRKDRDMYVSIAKNFVMSYPPVAQLFSSEVTGKKYKSPNKLVQKMMRRKKAKKHNEGLDAERLMWYNEFALGDVKFNIIKDLARKMSRLNALGASGQNVENLSTYKSGHIVNELLKKHDTLSTMTHDESVDYAFHIRELFGESTASERADRAVDAFHDNVFARHVDLSGPERSVDRLMAMNATGDDNAMRSLMPEYGDFMVSTLQSLFLGGRRGKRIMFLGGNARGMSHALGKANRQRVVNADPAMPSRSRLQGVENDNSLVPSKWRRGKARFGVVAIHNVLPHISRNRSEHLDLAKSYMEQDGLLSLMEVATGRNDVSPIFGDKKNMVSGKLIEAVLSSRFKYVVQYWANGRAKGYFASDSKATISRYLYSMPNPNKGGKDMVVIKGNLKRVHFRPKMSAEVERQVMEHKKEVDDILNRREEMLQEENELIDLAELRELPDVGRMKNAPRGSPGPNRLVHWVKDRYLDERGVKSTRAPSWASNNRGLMKRIRNWYSAVGSSASHRVTREAYARLSRETRDIFDDLEDSGISFYFVDRESYPYIEHPYQAVNDLNHTRTIAVPRHGVSDRGHPLLRNSERTGHGRVRNRHRFMELSYADLLQAVEHVMGYAAEGVGFGPGGRENAYRNLVRLYSPDARGALATEVRGGTRIAEKATVAPKWVQREGVGNLDDARSWGNYKGRDEVLYARASKEAKDPYHLRWKKDILRNAKSRKRMEYVLGDFRMDAKKFAQLTHEEQQIRRKYMALKQRMWKERWGTPGSYLFGKLKADREEVGKVKAKWWKGEVSHELFNDAAKAKMRLWRTRYIKRWHAGITIAEELNREDLGNNFRIINGAASMAEAAFNFGPIKLLKDADGKISGNEYMQGKDFRAGIEALNLVSNTSYRHLRKAVEYMILTYGRTSSPGQGDGGGQSIDEDRAAELREYANEHPEIKEFAGKWVKFKKDMLHFYRDLGYISEHEFQIMQNPPDASYRPSLTKPIFNEHNGRRQTLDDVDGDVVSGLVSSLIVDVKRALQEHAVGELLNEVTEQRVGGIADDITEYVRQVEIDEEKKHETFLKLMRMADKGERARRRKESPLRPEVSEAIEVRILLRRAKEELNDAGRSIAVYEGHLRNVEDGDSANVKKWNDLIERARKKVADARATISEKSRRLAELEATLKMTLDEAIEVQIAELDAADPSWRTSGTEDYRDYRVPPRDFGPDVMRSGPLDVGDIDINIDGRRIVGKAIRVRVRGEERYYLVEDQAMLEMVQSMTPREMGWVMKMAMATKNLISASVTAAPVFWLRNSLRDTQQGFVIGKTWQLPVVGTFRGAAHAMIGGRSDLYKEWLVNGGGFSGLMEIEGAIRPNDLMDGHLRGNIDISRPIHAAGMVARMGWRAFTFPSRMLESGTRIDQYRVSRKKGLSHREAIIEARRVSTDFADVGASAGAVYAWLRSVPFFISSLNGLNATYEAMFAQNGGKFHPLNVFNKKQGQKVLIATGMLTLMSALIQIWNTDDDEGREIIEGLTAFERQGHWHLTFLKIGDEHVRIPKAFDIPRISSMAAELVVDAMTGTKGVGLGEYGKEVLKNFMIMEVVPGVANPIAAMATNRNFFGDPIVPEAIEEYPVGFKYFRSTPKIFRGAADFINRGLKVVPGESNPTVSALEVQEATRTLFTNTARLMEALFSTLLWDDDLYGPQPFPQHWRHSLGYAAIVSPDQERHSRYRDYYWQAFSNAVGFQNLVDNLRKNYRTPEEHARHINWIVAHNDCIRASVRVRAAWGRMKAIRKESDYIAHNPDLTREQKEARMNEIYDTVDNNYRRAFEDGGKKMIECNRKAKPNW